MQSIYNLKLQEEKKSTKTKSNKGKEMGNMKGAAAKGADRNNNNAMINDVIGNHDDAYGDYGDEGEGFRRENEKDYDFM